MSLAIFCSHVVLALLWLFACSPSCRLPLRCTLHRCHDVCITPLLFGIPTHTHLPEFRRACCPFCKQSSRMMSSAFHTTEHKLHGAQHSHGLCPASALQRMEHIEDNLAKGITPQLCNRKRRHLIWQTVPCITVKQIKGDRVRWASRRRNAGDRSQLSNSTHIRIRKATRYQKTQKHMNAQRQSQPRGRYVARNEIIYTGDGKSCSLLISHRVLLQPSINARSCGAAGPGS